MYKLRFVYGAGLFSDILFESEKERDEQFNCLKEGFSNNANAMVSSETVMIFLNNVLFIEKIDE